MELGWSCVGVPRKLTFLRVKNVRNRNFVKKCLTTKLFDDCKVKFTNVHDNWVRGGSTPQPWRRRGRSANEQARRTSEATRERPQASPQRAAKGALRGAAENGAGSEGGGRAKRESARARPRARRRQGCGGHCGAGLTFVNSGLSSCKSAR